MSPLKNGSDPPGNLSLPLNSFIGRRRETADVTQLLVENRLLTLTGAGGCGKTRLAMHVARDQQATYQDGAWLVEFAALSNAALVPQLVASVLDVREKPGRPPEQSLVAFLRPRNLLLLLDNCEHLLPACAPLVQLLLENCPNVRILATSREPLGVLGEAVWVVPPLSLPRQQPWSSPSSERESLVAYRRAEAVQLFVDRARKASPDFELTADNGPWIATICRRLDGIPLAIELAAAEVRYFSLRQIAARLDDRFLLLTNTLRTAPERHQTLEAVLDWSYALLAEAEQEMINRLSIFANGWTLEAAAAVCAPSEDKTAAALNNLARLVDKSLVVVKPADGDRRYYLLETIRHYAWQKLAQSGEEVVNQTRDRHLDYFTRWAGAEAKQLIGRQQAVWLEKFNIEHDNVRAALEWSRLSPGKGPEGLRLAAAYAQFWRLRGFHNEGRARLETALAASDRKIRKRTRAMALLWAANLAYLQSDYEATRALAKEGLIISKTLGPAGAPGIAKALDILGEMATEIGDYEAAGPLLEEALRIYEEIGDTRGSADMRMQLGWAAMREGNYGRAATWLVQALRLFRLLDETALIAIGLGGLGELAVRQGRYEEALALLDESLALRRELDNPWGIASALGTLGWIALLLRDYRRLRLLLRESLEIRLAISDQGGTAWCLEKLAEAAVLEATALPSPYRRRLRERAARTFGKAAALREEVSSVIDPADQASYQQTLDKLRRALDKTAFDAAWEEGRLTLLEEVVQRALAPALTAKDAAALSQSRANKIRFGGLTPREQETAVYIAGGMSNRQIADTMTVGLKTVETYVSRILNKLGFESRVQIATWALQIGLAESLADDS